MEGEQNNVNVDKEGGGSIGPIIGIIVILAIIIFGGLYFWSQREGGVEDGVATEAEAGAVIETINIQSESDDTTSIENDLDATNIDNLDSELNAS